MSELLTKDRFDWIVRELTIAGFAEDDIAWQENVREPTDPDDFASEAIFVICNSGMKHTIARKIFDRLMPAVEMGIPAIERFGHPGKAEAIDFIWMHRRALLERYKAAEDKVAFCVSLPWIGDITKYHLAKNFGAQVAKPDVHLQRLADLHGETAQGLCERLSAEVGLKVPTVDLVLWRACAVGVLNGKTGEITPWGGQPGEGEYVGPR